MSRLALHHLLSAAVVVALVAEPVIGSGAASDDYKIIVHPDNPMSVVDRGFLREIYLRKATDWSGGGPIRPIDLARRFAVRDRFALEVLKKTPAQLKSYWNQQIFSGKGVPPPEAESPADVVRYVLDHPGAVGYVPASTGVGRAKVIEVK